MKIITINNPHSRYPDSLNNERGMTLVEILAVITLLSLIFVVVGRGILGKSDAAKAKLNVTKMENVKQALSQYRLDFNTYPPTIQGLVSAPSDVKSSGKLYVPFLEEEDLKDIWGTPYRYSLENDGRTYSLSSLGSDGGEGGEGANQDVTLRP
ncbi:MAG: type II secretion system major pseudopilin GspG [bacterium]|nr:type II secretion system major pseudopilin GspG [bacterium]